MKHEIVWWWYLGVAWWLYSIKWLLSRKSSNTSLNADNDKWYQLMHEAEESIIDFLKNSDGRPCRQTLRKVFPSS